MSIFKKVANRLLDKLLGPVLDPNDFSEALTEVAQETIKELQPRTVPPVTTQPSEWEHCDKPDYYRLLIPKESADPSKKQPAYMATVIENKETGEVRVVPYCNVPMKLSISAEVDTMTSKIKQDQQIVPNLPEN